jgi:hypothetical protein
MKIGRVSFLCPKTHQCPSIIHFHKDLQHLKYQFRPKTAPQQHIAFHPQTSVNQAIIATFKATIIFQSRQEAIW